MVAPNPDGYELLLDAWEEHESDLLDDWLTWFEVILGDDEQIVPPVLEPNAEPNFE